MGDSSTAPPPPPPWRLRLPRTRGFGFSHSRASGAAWQAASATWRGIFSSRACRRRRLASRCAFLTSEAADTRLTFAACCAGTMTTPSSPAPCTATPRCAASRCTRACCPSAPPVRSLPSHPARSSRCRRVVAVVVCFARSPQEAAHFRSSGPSLLCRPAGARAGLRAAAERPPQPSPRRRLRCAGCAGRRLLRDGPRHNVRAHARRSRALARAAARSHLS